MAASRGPEELAVIRTVDARTDVDQDDVDARSPPAASGSQPRSNSRGSQYRAQNRKPALQLSQPLDYSSPYPYPRTSRSSRPPPARQQEDEGVDDGDYGEGGYSRDTDQRHPDLYARRAPTRARGRPPRAYLNRPAHRDDDPDGSSPTAWKRWSDASPRDSRFGDEEMAFGRPRVDWKTLSSQEKAEVLRLPWTQWMNSSIKNHFVAALGEFVGTTLFLFFAFAGTGVANIKSKASSTTTTGGDTGYDIGSLLYISLSFGFSLMVNVWIFFRISGGLFNPAVTLGMFLVQAIDGVRAVCLFVSQMLGSLLASVIVRFLFPTEFNVRTTLGTGVGIVQGVFIEAILTSELVFCIFMLAKEKHRATFIAPVGIGLALFIAELVGVQYTGGSLNPARSFGPCVVTATFDKTHWIYWVGPIIGALIAVIFYKFMKILEYEMANPGADGDPSNDPTVNPEKRAELPSARPVSIFTNS